MLAYRLLLRRGEWDVDGFLATIPASMWAELKVAWALIESQDDWVESLKLGNKKPWEPPTFGEVKEAKGQRRRLSGVAY